MIRIITGLPGGGKGLFCLDVIIEELLHGERLICTNLPLKIEELCEYLGNKGFTGDIHQRLRILNDDEAKCFFLYREKINNLKLPSDEEVKRGVNVDYGNHLPVLYVITEAHIYFDSRNWARTGPHLTFYASQHRHLGDDCYFDTQSESFLESRVRKLAQEFVVCRNLTGTRFMSIFRLPPKFIRITYAHPPEGAPQKPLSTSLPRSLDLPRANCYDTTAGVGIQGRGKPVEKIALKGIPWYFLLIAVALVLFLIWYVPTLFLTSKKADNATATHPAAQFKPSLQTNLPSILGIVRTGQKFTIYLSDGTRFNEFDAPRIERISRDFILMKNGDRFHWKFDGDSNAALPAYRPPQAAAAGGGG